MVPMGTMLCDSIWNIECVISTGTVLCDSFRNIECVVLMGTNSEYINI